MNNITNVVWVNRAKRVVVVHTNQTTTAYALPNGPTQVSTTTTTNVIWGTDSRTVNSSDNVNASQTIYSWTPSANAWTIIPGQLDEVYVSADASGCVVGVKEVNGGAWLYQGSGAWSFINGPSSSPPGTYFTHIQCTSGLLVATDADGTVWFGQY